MNNRALVLSLAMAVFAVMIGQSYISSIEQGAKSKYGTEVQVVVAKKDIKEMDTLSADKLDFKRIPKQFVEPGALKFESGEKKDGESETKETMINDLNKRIFGAIALVPVRKGEQLTYAKFTEPGIRTGLSPQVNPGRRAVAINVSDLTGVAKLVKPGDRVDVVAVIDMGQGKESKIAKTILQEVVVLAVGRNVTNNAARSVESDASGGKEKVRSLTEDSNFNTVTVEVEPVHVQQLALLVGSGDAQLFLALRNTDDQARVDTGSTSMAEILGGDFMKTRRVPAGR